MKHFTTGLVIIAALTTTALAQNNYTGNGGTSFGGAIGAGSLMLSDDGTTLTGTLTRGAGNYNDVFVIYIDSVADGFSDTSTFADTADGLRKAISGFNGGTDRSTLTMPAGFQADYALALGPASDGFGGLWQLASGGNNSLNFVSSANLSPTGSNSAGAYTFSIALGSIGATSFNFVSTYISNTGYRSNESIATPLTGTPVDAFGNFGYSAVSADNFAAYPIPEPTTTALLAGGVLGAGLFLRRRKA